MDLHADGHVPSSCEVPKKRRNAETRKQKQSKPKPTATQNELPYQQVLRTMERPGMGCPCATAAAQELQVPSNMAQLARKTSAMVHHLYDGDVAPVIEHLMLQYGQCTHSAFLDASFSIFLSNDHQAAICFKLSMGVAVVYGDPLCSPNDRPQVFDSFRKFCRRQRWQVAVVGASQALADHVAQHSWKQLEFGAERVLNPLTSPILDGKAGRSIARSNRKLVESGLALGLYDPAVAPCALLEQQLLDIYAAWRSDRRRRNVPEAYTLVFDPFALPRVSRYLYAIDPQTGHPVAFAGLQRLGAATGGSSSCSAVVEPLVAAPAAPRGATDFLVTHALGLLRDEGVAGLTFGLEALPDLGRMTGLPDFSAGTLRRVYRKIYDVLGLSGRRAFHEKFRPEDEARPPAPLYLLFPPGLLAPNRLRVVAAVLDVAHISLYDVWRRARGGRGVTGMKICTDSHKSG